MTREVNVTSELGLLLGLLVCSAYLVSGQMTVEAAAIASSLTFVGFSFLPVRNTEIFSPLTLLSFSYFVFLLVGALIFEILRARDYLPEAQLYIFSGYILFMLGMLLGNFIFRFTQKKGSYTLFCVDRRVILFLFLVAAVSYAYLLSVGGIPLFSENPDHARLQFFAGKGHIAIFFRSSPVLSLALLVDALSRGDAKRLRTSHLIFVIVVVANALTGARGVTLSVLLIYLLVYISIQGIKPTKVVVFGMASVALVFMSIIGSLRRYGELSLEGMWGELVIVLSARPAAVQLVIDRFPEGHEFGVFNYLSDISRLIPGVDIGQNVKVRDIIFANSSEMHQLAGINPSIIGEAMMNVGRHGIFLVPVLIGLFASWLYSIAKSTKPSFLTVSLYFTVLTELLIGITSGIGPRMPGLFISVFWIVMIDRLFKRKQV